MTDAYWLEQCEADQPKHDDWLSAAETRRLLALRFPKRRAEWRLGRWTVKQAVCAYLHLPADYRSLAAIEVRPDSTGAPLLFVDGNSGTAVVSLSHRNGMALCAIAPADVTLGCDLEQIEERSTSFAADYFTAEEYAAVCAAPKEDRSRLVTLLWSAKESALKALREGLRLDTRSVQVVSPRNLHTFAIATWHPLLVKCERSELFHGWWQFGDGFVRTLLAAPAPFPPARLNCAGPSERLGLIA